MLSRFGQLLESHAKRAGISKQELARLAGFKSRSTLTDSLKADGAYKVSLTHLDVWADKLGLTGKEREEFIFAAHLEHATPQVRERMEKLERENALLKERLKAAERPKQPR